MSDFGARVCVCVKNISRELVGGRLNATLSLMFRQQLARENTENKYW